jgi:lipopolysaccharide transport system ATP-binding protein
LSALFDISFDVSRGERIGIVGDNGSGKTTLLKIVAGLHKISGGEIDVRGRVTLVASLGVGMMEELTVAENIFLYGAIYGLGRRTMSQRQAEILEWAELEGFAQSRLKTLSSGMKTRLAFSALRHIEEDIYLLDEVLTAGDKNFMHKCEQVFAGYKKTQKTFLVTTHDLKFVRTFCEKTLWLHKGCQVGFGKTEEIVDQYVEAKLT